MSTRGTLAVGTAESWHGVYVHYDAYPSVLGRCIWALVQDYRTRFDDLGDAIRAVAADYIDAHPGGWSYLPDASSTDRRYRDGKCYCHDKVSRIKVTFSGRGLAGHNPYILDADSGTLTFKRDRTYTIDLAGSEPDWDALDWGRV